MVSMRLLAITSLFVLTACGGSVQKTLGMESRAPDEFRVVSRPPLSVPPQFSLRPPAIGSDVANPYATDRQAEALITGQPATAPAGGGQTFTLGTGNANTAIKPVEVSPVDSIAGTTAESQFLMNAGAGDADPTVRKTLVEERYVKQEEKLEEDWWDIWGESPDKKETTVNANKEAERIKQNQDEGKPVTEGETPVVKPRDRGILGRILGD